MDKCSFLIPEKWGLMKLDPRDLFRNQIHVMSSSADRQPEKSLNRDSNDIIK